MTTFEIIILLIYYFVAVGFMLNAYTDDTDDNLKSLIINTIFAICTGLFYFPIILGFMLYDKLNDGKKL